MALISGPTVATAIAEFFREEGKEVMFLLDSITRVAMAQRALQNVRLAMAENYEQMDIVNPAVLDEIGLG